MKASNNAYQLIRTHEGLALMAYLCPANKLTIGYGHTGSDVKIGMTINKVQAELLLKQDVEKCETQINALGLKINQNQFDAILDFVFNLGFGNFKASTLLRKIMANANDLTIKEELSRWIYGGDGSHDKKDNDHDGLIDEVGEKMDLSGLIKRRAAEAELYFK